MNSPAQITVTVDTLQTICNNLSAITERCTKLAQTGVDSSEAGKMGLMLFLSYINNDILVK